MESVFKSKATESMSSLSILQFLDAVSHFHRSAFLSKILAFLLDNTTSGQPLYSNLALDPVLFQGEGDYQFDIYRKMRDFNK